MTILASSTNDILELELIHAKYVNQLALLPDAFKTRIEIHTLQVFNICNIFSISVDKNKYAGGGGGHCQCKGRFSVFVCLFVWCHNAILTTTYPTTQAAFNGDLSLVESRGWTLSPTII